MNADNNMMQNNQIQRRVNVNIHTFQMFQFSTNVNLTIKTTNNHNQQQNIYNDGKYQNYQNNANDI